jgi:hypothetical protein
MAGIDVACLHAVQSERISIWLWNRRAFYLAFLPNEVSYQFVGRVQCLLEESNDNVIELLSQSWETLKELENGSW